MENRFSITRMLNFMRRQAALNFSSLMIAAGAVFGALLVISLLVGYFGPQNITNLINVYLVAFFLCGLVFTARIFSELHIPQKSYAWLTLPVSTGEKFWASWLSSSPVFVLVFFAACALIYFIACITGNSIDAFTQMFSKSVVKAIASFIVIQSIFFLGAVYFRNNNLMKTIFALFLIAMAFSVYSGVLTWLFWNRHGNLDLSISSKDMIGNTGRVISFAFWFLLGPFMLLVSYFRLKERQV